MTALEAYSKRLGARPMSLAFGEVAEYRRPRRWLRMAIDAAVLILAGCALFVVCAIMGVGQ